MQKSSAMEEEIDIYADLTTNNDENSEKCTKCEEFETQFQLFQKKVKDLEKVTKSLENNISSLLLTAKGEVSRKDRMIADLRNKLDDKLFGRGRFRHQGNSKSSSEISESVTAISTDQIGFNKNVPPPPLLLENIPAPYESGGVKNVDSDLEIVDSSEYICNSEPYIEEEEDTEQKYEKSRIINTIFSQRLRKRIEEEDLQKKALEKQETEKKDKDVLPIPEESVDVLKPTVPENEKEGSLKCNLDNKENVVSSNQLQGNLTSLVTQSKAPASVEENPSRNRPVLVNKSSLKRSHADQDEEIEKKRTKVESLPSNRNFKQDRDTGDSKSVKNKQSSESFNFNGNRNDNFDKTNKLKETECDKKTDRIEEPRNNLLASRLYQLSEQSASVTEERRRDNERRQDDAKSRGRNRDHLERGRTERSRTRGNKYSDRFEIERYDKDYYDDKYDKSERRRNDKSKYEKYDYDRYERDRYESERYEHERYERERYKTDKYSRTTRRMQSLSPERNIYSHKDLVNREIKDNVEKRCERTPKYEVEDLRDKLNRPNSEESKLILETFNFRRERRFKGSSSSRSKSCGDKDRKAKESRNFERSRSRSKEKELKVTNPDKKISLESYRSRRDHQLCKNDSSAKNEIKSTETENKIQDKNLEKSTVNSEKKVITENSSQKENSTKVNEKIECSTESKLSARKSVEKETVKVNLENKKSRLSDIPEESFHKKELEEGEITDTTLTSFSISQLPESGKTQESVPTKISETLDKLKPNIEKTKIVTSVENKEIKNIREEKITNVNSGENKLPIDKSTSVDKKSENVKASTQSNALSPSDQETVKSNKIENYVQSLDSFIESAERVLEENKEEYRLGLISTNIHMELRGEIPLQKAVEQVNLNPKNSQNTGENESQEVKTSELLKEVPSPIKEKKKRKREKSKEKKIEKEISSSVKSRKGHKRAKLNEEKEPKVSSPLKGKKIKIVLKESSKSNPLSLIKEKKIKVNNRKNLKNNPPSPIKVKNVKITNEESSKNNSLSPIKVKNVEITNEESSKNNSLSPVKEKKMKMTNEESSKNNPVKAKKMKMTNEESSKNNSLSPVKDKKVKIPNEESSKINPLSPVKEKEIIAIEESSKINPSSPVKEIIDNKENSKNNPSTPVKEKEIITNKENSKNNPSSPVKEKEIITNKTEISEEKSSIENITKPLEESQAPEVKTKELPTESVTLGNDQQQKELESNAVVLPNISRPIKEKKEHFKELQVLMEVLPKSKQVVNSEEIVKPKETKKQIQKAKQIPETKPKTKKSLEKINKPIVVVVKRRRPVVLSDTNASTTIVSKQNTIMNIKLDKNGDKNLLS